MNGTGRVFFRCVGTAGGCDRRLVQREPRTRPRASETLHMRSLRHRSQREARGPEPLSDSWTRWCNPQPKRQPILPTEWPAQSATSDSNLLAPFPSICPSLRPSIRPFTWSDAMSKCPMHSQGNVEIDAHGCVSVRVCLPTWMPTLRCSHRNDTFQLLGCGTGRTGEGNTTCT